MQAADEKGHQGVSAEVETDAQLLGFKHGPQS